MRSANVSVWVLRSRFSAKAVVLERYKKIARVIRARGKTGEVVVAPMDGLPLLVRLGLEVCVVPPLLKKERFRVVVDCRDADGAQIIRLEGSETIADAEELKGHWLLACEADLPLDLALLDAPRLIGREVEDARAGALGTIEDIMYGPTQATWVVEGPYGEVLVPAVEEMVESTVEGGPIRVNLPTGLVGGVS